VFASIRGTYISPSGGKTVVTFQPGEGPSIRGGPDLQPWRPSQFRVKEFRTLSSRSRWKVAKCSRCDNEIRVANSCFPVRR